MGDARSRFGHRLEGHCSWKLLLVAVMLTTVCGGPLKRVSTTTVSDGKTGDEDGSPIIVEPPVNQTVTVGSRVVLRCKLQKMPGAEMMWVKHNYVNNSWGSGPLVHGDPHVTILKDWSFSHSPLVLKNVKKEDSGWYTCAFKNNFGLTTETAYINVTDSPTITYFEWAAPLTNNTFDKAANSLVEFYCGIQPTVGSENPHIIMSSATITWLKNGEKIQKDRRVKMPGWSLKIAGLTVEDSGKYTCIVGAHGQQLQREFFLKVNYVSVSSPIIVEPPVNQTVIVGSRTVLRCKLQKMPEVEMMWVKHNYVNNSWGSGPLVHGDPHLTILKDWSFSHSPLVLENVKKEDSGWYTCAFKNNLGLTTEAAYINVTDIAATAHSKNPEKQSGNEFLYMIIGVIAGLVIILIVVIVSVTVFCFKKKKLKMVEYKLYHKPEALSQPLMKPRRISSRSSTSSYPSASSFTSRLSVPVDETFEFCRQRLNIQETIGEGAFGVVKKAIAYGLDAVLKSKIVAVKTIREDATYQEQCEFFKEVEVMKAVKKMGSHHNIVNFLGCCTQNGPLFVIVEYCKKGNLRDYLVSFRTQPNSLVGWGKDSEIFQQDDMEDPESAKSMLSEKILLSFAYQIARGMEFLAQHKCIHRDLAARNVLVTEDNLLKIADFGLARSGDYYKKKSAGQIPVKWMPPEALIDLKYTVKSDVWSFGIVLWEIFSLGGMPYPTIPHEDLYYKLIEGYRMEKPPLSPDSLYDTMKRCWNHFPDDRPDFNTLVLIMDRQLTRVSNGGYLEVLADDDTL